MNRISVFASSVFKARSSRFPQSSGAQGNGVQLNDSDAYAFGGSSPPLPLANQIFPKPLNLRKNQAEAERLQGIMRRDASAAPTSTSDGSTVNKVRHWFINEGSKRSFFAVWLIIHGLVFGLGFCHYQLKDNQANARATFGWTYAVARSAALVLHVDVAILLLPVCRNFITLIRRTYLNAVIPFDSK